MLIVLVYRKNGRFTVALYFIGQWSERSPSTSVVAGSILSVIDVLNVTRTGSVQVNTESRGVSPGTSVFRRKERCVRIKTDREVKSQLL